MAERSSDRFPVLRDVPAYSKFTSRSHRTRTPSRVPNSHGFTVTGAENYPDSPWHGAWSRRSYFTGTPQQASTHPAPEAADAEPSDENQA